MSLNYEDPEGVSTLNLHNPCFDAGDSVTDSLSEIKHAMKPILALTSALALLLSASSGFAQGTPTSKDGQKTDASENNSPFTDGVDVDRKRFWQASLPGGVYMVALDRITSISKHQYLLDGTLIITEVNIDTVGNSLVRIYHITPAAERSNLATPQRIVERGKELLEHAGQRTGTDPNSMVHKKYPVTTHTKTIEYRVEDLGTLDALYNSVHKAWRDGRGRRFVVR
jgi:hypothetical protein